MTALTITPMASLEELVPALAAEGLPVDDIEDDGRAFFAFHHAGRCLLYTSPSPRDRQKSRMPSSA